MPQMRNDLAICWHWINHLHTHLLTSRQHHIQLFGCAATCVQATCTRFLCQSATTVPNIAEYHQKCYIYCVSKNIYTIGYDAEHWQQITRLH